MNPVQDEQGASPARAHRSRPRHRSRSSRPTAVVLLVLALALVLGGQTVRALEAGTQALVLNAVGLEAQALGQAVIFPLDGRWVGVGFTLGCSIAPLTALFLGGSAIAAWVRPLRLRSVAVGVGALMLVFILANQVRIATIVAMMRLLGFERGYEVSHIFLGSAISTLGFVAAVIVFVRLVLREPVTASPAGAV